jgi:hypothetical protein
MGKTKPGAGRKKKRAKSSRGTVSGVGLLIKRLPGGSGDLSQKKFAERLTNLTAKRVTKSVLSSWLVGKAAPPADWLIRLANIAGDLETMEGLLASAGLRVDNWRKLVEKALRGRLVPPVKAGCLPVKPLDPDGRASVATSDDLFLPAQVIPALMEAKYCIIGKPFDSSIDAGDIIVVDASDVDGEGSLLPFWGRPVLVEVNVQNLYGARLGREVEFPQRYLVGTLYLDQTEVTPSKIRFKAELIPWGDGGQPPHSEKSDFLRPWLRKESISPAGDWEWNETRRHEQAPASLLGSETPAESARRQLRLHKEYRIVGRVIAWFRPSKERAGE